MLLYYIYNIIPLRKFKFIIEFTYTSYSDNLYVPVCILLFDVIHIVYIHIL